MARSRSAAIRAGPGRAGPVPVRMREASSPKVTSRTQWSSFSMAQCRRRIDFQVAFLDPPVRLPLRRRSDRDFFPGQRRQLRQELGSVARDGEDPVRSALMEVLGVGVLSV